MPVLGLLGGGGAGRPLSSGRCWPAVILLGPRRDQQPLVRPCPCCLVLSTVLWVSPTALALPGLRVRELSTGGQVTVRLEQWQSWDWTGFGLHD